MIISLSFFKFFTSTTKLYDLARCFEAEVDSLTEDKLTLSPAEFGLIEDC